MNRKYILFPCTRIHFLECNRRLTIGSAVKGKSIIIPRLIVRVEELVNNCIIRLESRRFPYTELTAITGTIVVPRVSQGGYFLYGKEKLGRRFLFVGIK